jgi:hypothetical protein
MAAASAAVEEPEAERQARELEDAQNGWRMVARRARRTGPPNGARASRKKTALAPKKTALAREKRPQ